MKSVLRQSLIGSDASVSPGLHRQSLLLVPINVSSGNIPGTDELRQEPPKSLSSNGLINSIEDPDPFAPTGQGKLDW